MTVGQVIASRIATMKENITVARFVRFKVGETQEAQQVVADEQA
jgi:hypothetical protein